MDEIIINENSMNESPRYSESVIRRAPLLAKWLWILFWVNIALLIIGFLVEIPALGLVVKILTAVGYLVVCFALYKMSEEDKRYGIAALLTLIAGILDTFLGLSTPSVPTVDAVSGGNTLASLAFSALMLAATYFEYHAHSCIVGGLNSDLGDRWKTLWVWKIISLVAIVAVFFVALISAVLGALCAIALAIFVTAVDVMVFVALYRSAQAYRAVVNYTQEIK